MPIATSRARPKHLRAVPLAPRENLQRGHTARRQAAEIRAAILETARALYAAGGCGAVTMRAIAHELGIKAPSLYHYFVGKDEIFMALQEHTLRLLQEAQMHPPIADPLEDLRLFYTRYYEFSKTHPDYFALLYVDRSAPAFDVGIYDSYQLQDLAAQAAAKIQRCIDARLFPPGARARAGSILWSAVHGPAALRLIHRRHGVDFDRLAVEALDLAIKGIRAGFLKKGPTRARRRSSTLK